MTSLFAPAPIVIAVLFAVAIPAPWLVRRWGRGVLALLALPLLAAAGWIVAMVPALVAGREYHSRMGWVGELGLTVDLRLDALAAVLCLVITVIGGAVLLYSVRYFPPGDDGLPKYAGSILAFAAAMLGLVLADNLLLLYVFWELTGILSYLLIAHRVRKQASRTAASQALLVTTAGGLAMLVGAVMLGYQAGTYRISEILAHPPGGAATIAAVLLLVIGGISKSAIVPFHFWLPGAMAAPTPASAYLHAATMVKAGIYLFARFAPAFAALGFWGPGLIALGAATMLLAGVVALRQRDLKLLLAYGTVSQLGMMTMLVGDGSPAALVAAGAFLIGHATFKAPLFFAVGIIDTSTGTRNLTELSGVGRRLPGVATLAGLAALSMAGLPPLVGFVSKEAAFASLLGGGTAGAWAAVAAVAGSVLTVAYTARFMWGAFARKPGLVPVRCERPSVWMVGPTAAVVAVSVVFGVWPAPLGRLLDSLGGAGGGVVGGAGGGGDLAVWHGFGMPLAMSAIALAGGLAVYAAQRLRERRTGLAVPGEAAGSTYRALLAGVDRVAMWVTSATQRGSLPVSLGAILLVLVAFPGSVLLASDLTIGPVQVTAAPEQALLALVAAALAFAVLRARYPIAAILLVGGIGYSVAVLYILRGAPDLALTQILVETVTLLVAVLVLVRMPSSSMQTPAMSAPARAVRVALAVGVGVVMTAAVLIMPGQRRAEPVSNGLTAPAMSGTGGTNVVNVILVDVRGWDTFGEISVLVAAAVGVSSLIFLRNPWMGRRGGVGALPAGAPVVANPSPWLRTDAATRRSLLLEVATRLVFHLIVMFSLYVLFVGHDEPGGGFAGGLIASIALALRYLAGGRHELAEAAPADPGVVMGSGLVIAAATAAGGLAVGAPALSSTVWHAQIPWLGDFTLAASTIFDIGVYLVVVGVVLEVLTSVGAELDRQAGVSASRRRPRVVSGR